MEAYQCDVEVPDGTCPHEAVVRIIDNKNTEDTTDLCLVHFARFHQAELERLATNSGAKFDYRMVTL